jgi:phage-related minor tail protein
MNDKEIAQLTDLLNQRTQLKAADRELEDATKEANRQRDEAIRKNKELADTGRKVYEDTRTPAEKLNIELARLNDLLAQGVIDWDTYERATNKAQDEFENFGKKGKDSIDELTRAIEGWGRQSADAITDFVFGAKSSFSDLVTSVLKDIARMLIYQSITKPLAAAIGGTDFMSTVSSFFGGARASGGPVAGGMTYLVGERGPELFTPSSSGSIVPNHALGGSTNVVVNVSVEGGGERVTGDQGAGTLGRMIAGAVKAELINQKRPGGLLAA